MDTGTDMSVPEGQSEIIVFGKNRCVQCDATKRRLNNAGIAYVLKNVEEDADARKEVVDAGYVQAPVTSFRGEYFNGYNTGKIDNIINIVKSEKKAQLEKAQLEKKESHLVAA